MRRFFVVEVAPSWSRPAESVKRFENDQGLRGLAVRSGRRWLRLIQNLTGKPLACQVPLPGAGLTVSLHRSGRRAKRPEMLTRSGTSHVPVTIAPGEHVVVVDSPDPRDHKPNGRVGTDLLREPHER